MKKSMSRVKLIGPEATYPLRHKILRPHMTLNDVKYEMDNSKQSFHVGAFNKENQLVCVVSLGWEMSDYFSTKKALRLRGMATDKEYQGLGFGKKVIQFAENNAYAIGAELIWFNAREVAFKFYESLGYKYKGSLFDIKDIGPHKVMYKQL